MVVVRGCGVTLVPAHLRRYRASLNSARRAADVWAAAGVDFWLQLGDVIDGKCEKGGKQASVDALNTVLSIFKDLPLSSCPRLDVNGNHEM